MAEIAAEMHDEAARLEESVMYSGQSQFEQAKLWRTMNLSLGIPAAALAGVAGGTGLTNYFSAVTIGWIALASAALAAALTVMNPSRRVAKAQWAANSYLALQTELRQFKNIDLPTMTADEARECLAGLTARVNEVNAAADIPSRFAYKKGKGNIEGGGQTYGADTV